MLVLVALGGNAMTGPDGSATPHAQREAIGRAMQRVADLVEAGHDVVVTHGNASDPGFTTPTKPVGRFLPHEQAKRLIEHGETWQDRGEHGWRRVVASPEPLEVLDTHAVLTLLHAGYVVVAAGGGGIPVVRTPGGTVHGVEAVVDKDLTAAVLARALGADVLVTATDVEHAEVGFGTPHARPLGRVSLEEMEGYAADGQFASGSMGPKVE